MRISVTGGTGFVGRAMVERLVKEGHEVRCLVRHPEKAGRNLPPGVTAVRGDVTRADGLGQAISGCEGVIHLVGIISERSGATFEQVHVEGTRNIVSAAQQSGVTRLLHMSALGSRSGAASRYHQTKYQAEEIVRQSPLDWTIFRPSVIYGPSDQFVNLLARVIRLSPMVLIFGDGRARLQPVALKDVVQCFVGALKNEATKGKIYSLGGSQALSFEELMDTLLRIMGKKRIKVRLPMSLVRPVVRLSDRILPVSPLSEDQLIMLQEDNVCDIQPAVMDFGVLFEPFSEGISSYVR